jgi:hypothetical protein
MPKRFLLVLAFCVALLPAQTIPTITIPTNALADTKGLVTPVTTMLAQSFALSVPFGAAAGNFTPLNYHFLIPVLDVYLTAPLIVSAGAIDLKALDSLPAGAGDSFKAALGPMAQFAYLPLPMLAVTGKARLQLPIPIVKDLELQFKFGVVPQFVKDLLTTALSGTPGFALDYDMSLFGIGARYRFVNLKVFSFGAGAMINTLDYRFNLKFTTPKQTIGTYANPIDGSNNMVIQQDMVLNLTNKFNSTVLSVDAVAGLNLLIFQLYAGVGLNFDLSGPYKSSYGISGSTYTNDVAVDLSTPLSFGDSVSVTPGALVPKFALGFRLSILDVQAESTFDLKAVAVRAGIAVSF